MNGEQRYSVDSLERFCVRAMMKAGMAEADAHAVVAVLVTTDTWGVHTHGTKQLRGLLGNFRDGKMDLHATAELIAEGPAWASYDGHASMPMISSCIAMRMAIEKAKVSGIAISTVRNSGHFGAAGYYSNMAASSECIGISMCNVDPGVAVPGSRGPVLGTNPISYAVPGLDGKTIFLDIATSIVAANKIFQAKATGQSIPEGWLIDGDGLPTTDSSEYPAAGALMPMAGHKGYGIALMVELLTGVLSGGAFGSEVVSWLSGPQAVNQSLTFVAISIGVFMDAGAFKKKVAALAAQIHHSPRAVGVDRIYVPGEMEWERRELALRQGVALPPDVVDSLRGLADDLSLDFAEVVVSGGPE